MKMIKKYVRQIDDELHSAETYAEKYIECKVEGDSSSASRYKTFVQQELEHAMFAHELAVKTIEKVSAVFAAPADMKKRWETSHSDYIARTTKIKSMLT